MAIRIYTKTGDKGSTSLIGGTKVSKGHLRIEAYGTIDELNSFIGLLGDYLTTATSAASHPSIATSPADLPPGIPPSAADSANSSTASSPAALPTGNPPSTTNPADSSTATSPADLPTSNPPSTAISPAALPTGNQPSAANSATSFTASSPAALPTSNPPSTATSPADLPPGIQPSAADSANSSTASSAAPSSPAAPSSLFGEAHPLLREIQDRLFTIGSSLACDPEKEPKFAIPDLHDTDILLLEKAIDAMDAELPAMKSFVLPGGHPAVSTAHIARCVCRRAERGVVRLQEETGSVEPLVLQYLNRLSDYLFQLARFISHRLAIPEIPWKPRI